MARPPRGQEDVDRALRSITTATTIEQLRQAQALIFPLRYGLSLEQTAEAIGVSRGWACHLQNQFIAGKVAGDKGKAVRGGRRRENFNHEREAELLKPFLESASTGGVLVVGQIKPQVEAAPGHTMALSSVHKLLHRHNWRKLSPDKGSPKRFRRPRWEERKRHETLVGIRQNWAKGDPLRLMFQYEARFGRIDLKFQRPAVIAQRWNFRLVIE